MNLRATWEKHSQAILVYAVAIALFVFVWVMRPGYADPSNLKILSAQAAILGLATLGQTIVLLTGGMDLSIPWVFTNSAFLMAVLSGGRDDALVWVLPLVLGLAVLMGLVNGIGVAYLGIAPVIMTIGTNVIFQGLLVGLSNGTPGGAEPPLIAAISTQTVGGISILLIIWVVISIGASIALSRTRFGREVYATGSSYDAARFSGVRVRRVTAAAYCLSALFAGLAGVLFAGRLGQLYLGMGDPYQMASVSAAAIGGISLLGGRGRYLGAIGGVLITVILNGVLSAMNMPQSVQMILNGAVLFLAVLASSRRRSAAVAVA
ncbi:MAG: ABC transporter permease [Propionibacteriaceae bacterium]|nr:ABC transporter permease [Propionibacteriaceae bacterium]